MLIHKNKCFASNISGKFFKLSNTASSNKANFFEFHNRRVKTRPLGYGFDNTEDKTVCIVKIRRLTRSKSNKVEQLPDRKLRKLRRKNNQPVLLGSLRTTRVESALLALLPGIEQKNRTEITANHSFDVLPKAICNGSFFTNRAIHEAELCQK